MIYEDFPDHVKIGDKSYKINTDFRVAIECDAIAKNENIKEYEKCLAIIYKLFGDEGLSDFENHAELLRLGQKFLSCGKEIDGKKNEKPDMDFIQDMNYIESSFMFDYNMDIKNKNIHWWEFMNLVEGFSNSEFGNCCILNRIRNLRNMNPREIKDPKRRKEVIDAQKSVALKVKKKEVKLTKEQEESMKKLDKLLGLDKR